MKQIDYLWFLKLRYAAAEIWHGSAATTPWCRSTQCTSIFHFRFQLSCLLLGFSWKMNFYDEPFLPMVSSKKIIDLNLSHSLHNSPCSKLFVGTFSGFDKWCKISMRLLHESTYMADCSKWIKCDWVEKWDL